ncbi:MAG: DUF5658 family protein [bacterium]
MGKDRRSGATPALSKYTLSGQRKGSRRASDNAQIYVDLYSHKLFLTICVILLLCVADGYFTLFNVFCLNIPELNPIMAYLLDKSCSCFFMVKYALTSLGLTFLCVQINFKFVRSTLLAILGFYLFILCSHLYIFSSLSPL